MVSKEPGTDAEDIRSFCEGRIAHFEIPREVIFVDQLPRNAMGKIVKEAVREMVLQKMTEEKQAAGG